eukprot:TRINITY_DN5058_c0_g1_i1.p1 TRINITY_DN5058_c0_g1~~TRINITY_DN5058_c0_g1_i1.p1  ORF type:complete len:532 (-),score=183.76 TRINITY_DN5058_c0_g1_i1:46-1641(-)
MEGTRESMASMAEKLQEREEDLVELEVRLKKREGELEEWEDKIRRTEEKTGEAELSLSEKRDHFKQRKLQWKERENQWRDKEENIKEKEKDLLKREIAVASQQQTVVYASSSAPSSGTPPAQVTTPPPVLSSSGRTPRSGSVPPVPLSSSNVITKSASLSETELQLSVSGTTLKLEQEASKAHSEEQQNAERRKDVAVVALRDVQNETEKALVIKKNLEAELVESRVKERNKRLHKIRQQNRKFEERLKAQALSVDEDDDEDESESDTLSEEEEEEEEVLKKPLSKKAQVVGKLNVLDKLDELMRKIDTLKVTGGGLPADVAGGRNYTELKTEIEEWQKIIVDDSGKYTDKEKEDANIKWEKTFEELKKTPEYKAEVAAALEEKRKINEPLNKAALEKMIVVYTPDKIKNDKPTKDRVTKSPELALIGMDPKAILAKHQNDFTQYLLHNLEMDELRAIRASLPKFRNDQKRQLDWVETLENKIEMKAKEPPKKPAPPKAPAIKFKPPPPPAGGAPVDMFAELKARRKQIDG